MINLRNKTVIFALIFLMCALTAKAGSSLQVDRGSWDFGLVTQGSVLEKEITVSNSGDSTLVVKEVVSDCDCLDASISRTMIPPYGYATVNVKYDSSGKPAGEDIVSVAISTGSKINPQRTITFYATIAPSGKKYIEKPEVPGISSAELYEQIGDGLEPLIVDVRSRSAYNVRHIPGAISMPRDLFKDKDPLVEEFISSVPGGRILVVYCGTGYNSSFVVQELRKRGYEAFNLDGISHWTNKGYPVEEGGEKDGKLS